MNTGNKNTNPKKDKTAPRFRTWLFSVLLTIYLITCVCYAFWYWMRPIRKEQFINAYEKWQVYSEIYNIPAPTDNKYGFDNQ